MYINYLQNNYLQYNLLFFFFAHLFIHIYLHIALCTQEKKVESSVTFVCLHNIGKDLLRMHDSYTSSMYTTNYIIYVHTNLRVVLSGVKENSKSS
jgi:hypothetical protein